MSNSTRCKNPPESVKAAVASLEEKKKYEDKAHQIVYRLAVAERSIDPDWLINAGRHIQPSHYQDVVEERSVANKCGYPLCCNNLQDIPKQKYRISTAKNCVYDITERKNFCSNACFKGSQFYKDQLLTSPLWYREDESFPTITLLSSTKHKQSGKVGDEIPLGVEREKRDLVKQIKQLDLDEENVVKYDSETDDTNETEQNNAEKPYEEIKIQIPKSPVLHVEECLREWFTIDTVLMVLGERIVCDLVVQSDLWKKFENRGVEAMDPVLKLQHALLCKKLDKEERIEEREETDNYMMPLVDSVAQNALRRRILLDALDKVIPDLLNAIGYRHNITTDLQKLVGTLGLGPKNIVFQPSEWNILGLAIIKILSLTNPPLCYSMSNSQHVTLILMSYDLDGGYLDRLTMWLTEVDYLLEKLHATM